MLIYQPPAFKPIRASLRGVLIGQQEPIDVTPGQVKSVGVITGLVVSAFSAATAWVGISTGQRESGLLSIAGWAVGLVGGLTGAMALLGTFNLATTPLEEIQRAINEAQAGSAPPASPTQQFTVVA